MTAETFALAVHDLAGLFVFTECHTLNDGDSDWAHMLFARQSQYSSLRSYFTMTRMEPITMGLSNT